MTTYFKAVRDRFERRVRPSESGCLIWTGGHDSDGRGRFWLNGKNIPAPRAALLLAGFEVPIGTMVCHHCDVPACVRIDHLYVGDARSNVHDMLDRGRNRGKGIPRIAARGERNHNAKLSDEQVAQICTRYRGKRGEQSALAREFGVTPQLVHMIVKGAHRVSV